MRFADKTDDELVLAAASGDRTAAGEYFSRHLGFLSAMARRLSGGVIDADDLLADAIAGLLGKWTGGGGPHDHVNTYLIRSMKNRVIDEVRSPRSRVATTDWNVEPIAEEQVQLRAADLHREFGYVQRALAQLPDDQRTVLTATVVDGRKSGELEDELGRPASAIYSLVRRSRIGLRRGVLRVMLEEDAPPRCRRHASQLPELVPDDPDDAGPSKGMTHIRGCPRCRAVWARFGALSSTLGVSTLLVIGSAIGGPAPAAQAVGPGAGSGPDASTGRGAGSAGGSVSPPAAAAARRALRTRRLLLVSGIAAVAFGTILTAMWVMSMVRDAQPVTASTPTGSFTVDVTVEGATTASMAIGFGVAGSDWAVEELTIVLSDGVRYTGAPEGWTCSQAAATVDCTATTPSPTGGSFVLESARGWDDREYQVLLRARADGTAFTGRASGLFDPDGNGATP